MADLPGRNIKRRLQQLETFNRGLSISSPTSKQQPHSSQMSPKNSTQFEKTCVQSITPAASDALLSGLETTNVQVEESSDTSSIQAVFFGSTEDTEAFSSMPEQEDSSITSQQRNDEATGFDFITPLTDLENENILLVCLL